MKAVTYRTYGSPDVLTLDDVDRPVVGDDDVLVRVFAAGVNPADWHYLIGTPYLVRTVVGLRRPRETILGKDIAGRVEAVGANITTFQPGDEVFGENSAGFAEYVCVPERGIVRKPANITFEQAASVPIAALTALQGLRDKAGITAGQHVLVNGASGGVGTFAVQIAKSYGAEVTGVCSTRNIDMVRSIGADHVIDYTVDDFTQGDERYDIIIDNVGNHSLAACRRVLSDAGVYVAVGGTMGNWIGPLTQLAKVAAASLFRRKKMVSMLAKQTVSDLLVLQGLLESSALTPVIDRTYELADAADAMRHQGAGHARGKTVITITRN